MPQRPIVPIVQTAGMDLMSNIRDAWNAKQLRPTAVLVGTRKISSTYAVLLVGYENGSAHQPLILPQCKLESGKKFADVALALLADAFLLSPARTNPKDFQVHCYGYFDHFMGDRKPEGFKVGKRLYFLEMDLDKIEISSKHPALQQDPNPVTMKSFVPDLGAIRNTLKNISHEGKRRASIGMVEDALLRRFNRDHATPAKKSAMRQVA